MIALHVLRYALSLLITMHVKHPTCTLGGGAFGVRVLYRPSTVGRSIAASRTDSGCGMLGLCELCVLRAQLGHLLFQGG
eukprot:COSAG01_NODE_60513_length_294_cov_1.030769_1_plen_78_part_10